MDDVEPLTEKERAKLVREWFQRTLDKLWFMALGDDELKKAFRDKAENMKGKTSPRSEGALRWLLMHYAMGVEMFGDDRARVLDWLIDWNKRVYGGVLIDRTTMDNRISNAITTTPIKALPEWAHKAISERRAKYRAKKKPQKSIHTKAKKIVNAG